MRAEFHYGKAQVSTYRTYGAPLTGVTAIPECAFTGRGNVLLAAEIDVQVMGESFYAAYTEGDNTKVVPTDTMKNFIHRQSLDFTGSTLEGWLFFLGERFLETYPQMERLRVSGEELRFEPVRVPSAGATEGFEDSSVLFQRRHDDRAIASLEIDREADGSAMLVDLRSGRADMELIKVTGSAFAAFPRDEFTTLPERKDRPLFVHLDVAWRYLDPAVAVMPDSSSYVAHEQVRDLVSVVFHEFVSLSIQHLVNEMGARMLGRFPQLAEVSFEAQNRLWDLAETSSTDERIKVYTDPRPPYGRIGLTLHRE
jgi:urate oxidase / 2-oxo-4-hydroxy-4-carboxy-5-ureidoimidazoline decarboxylase